MKAPKTEREHRALWGVEVETPDGAFGVIHEPDDEDTDWKKKASVMLDGEDYKCDYFPTYNWADLEPYHDEGDEDEDFQKEEKASIMGKLGMALATVKDKTIDSGKAGAMLTVGKQAAKRSLAIFLKARKTGVKKPSPVIMAVEGFLSTDLGLGVYAVVAGTGLIFIPRFAGNEKWSKLAGAMQTYGFHVITDGVLDPILDEIQNELGDLLDKAADI